MLPQARPLDTEINHPLPRASCSDSPVTQTDAGGKVGLAPHKDMTTYTNARWWTDRTAQTDLHQFASPLPAHFTPSDLSAQIGEN